MEKGPVDWVAKTVVQTSKSITAAGRTKALFVVVVSGKTLLRTACEARIDSFALRVLVPLQVMNYGTRVPAHGERLRSSSPRTL